MTTTTVTTKDIQELRQRTGAGMMDAKKALTDANGDMAKAAELLRTRGVAKAEKRASKVAGEGFVGSYIHHNGKLGVIVELNCETDFVARNPEFRELASELAKHIAAANPVSVDKDGVPADVIERERRIFEEQVKASGKPEHLIQKIVDGKVESFYKDVSLLHQEYVRDPKKKVGDLISELSAKVGEKIAVRRFARFQVGEE